MGRSEVGETPQIGLAARRGCSARFMNLPSRVISTRPAVSSSLMWCDIVAALTSCVSLQGAAGTGVAGLADLLEDLVAPRLGQGAGDARELAFGERFFLARRHRVAIVLRSRGGSSGRPAIPIPLPWLLPLIARGSTWPRTPARARAPDPSSERTQVQNPVTGDLVKRDDSEDGKGRFMDVKEDGDKFKGVATSRRPSQREVGRARRMTWRAAGALGHNRRFRTASPRAALPKRAIPSFALERRSARSERAGASESRHDAGSLDDALLGRTAEREPRAPLRA